MSLERYYWDALDRIAHERGLRTAQLIAAIEEEHAAEIRANAVSTSSVLRIYVAAYHQTQAPRAATPAFQPTAV